MDGKRKDKAMMEGKRIPLKLRDGTEVGSTIVDEEDFEWLSQWTWRLHETGYAYRGTKSEGKVTVIYLHLLLVDVGLGKQADHRNRDKLDNRRSNLREATISQQRMNRGIQSNNKSGYKGVVYDKRRKRYKAEIKAGRKKFLGYFDTAEEAAIVYESASRELFGEFSHYATQRSPGEENEGNAVSGSDG